MAILRYVQSTNMTPQQFAVNLISKSYKVADVYDESTLKNIYVELFAAFTCHSLSNYWSTTPQPDLIDIAF